MSTILDALKRLEEQLRKDAAQKAADSGPTRLELFTARADAPPSPPELAPLDENEATKVYMNLVDLLGGIQNRVNGLLESERAESAKSAADMAKRLDDLQSELARRVDDIQSGLARQTGSLRDDLRRRDDALEAATAAAEALRADLDPIKAELARMQEAHREDVRQRDADLHAARATLAASQSQLDPLRQDTAETNRAIADLARAVSAIQNDLAWQRETHNEEIRMRDAEIAEGKAAVAASQTELFPLRQDAAESKRAVADLDKALKALQDDTARQLEALREQIVQLEAARMAAPPPQAAQEKSAQAAADSPETREMLAQVRRNIAALQHDLARAREQAQEEAGKRDADQKAAQNAAAAVKSQVDAMAKSQAAATDASAELKRTAAQLQHQVERQQDAIQELAKRHDAERENEKAASAAVARHVDELAQASAQVSALVAELAQEIAALRNDFAHQRDDFAHQREELAHQRDAQSRDKASIEAAVQQAMRDAAETASASMRNEFSSWKKDREETALAVANLTRAVATLQSEYARQREAFREEIRQRDAEREAIHGALVAIQSQLEANEAAEERGPGAAGSPDVKPTVMSAETRETVSTPPLDKYAAQKLHGVAAKAYGEGRYAEALRMLETIDSAFPNNTSVIYNRAACLIALERHDEARKLCDDLVVRLNYAPAEELRNRLAT